MKGAKVFCNPFEQQGEWYKANLHTHTTVSDGRASAQERIAQYGQQGYSVVAITDHDALSDVADLSTPGLLVIDGIEFSVRAPSGGGVYHIVCLSVPPDATVPQASVADEVVGWALREGGESILAHPYWSGNDAQDILKVRGVAALEVFNASCLNMGKATSSVHWDNVLARGAQLPGLAVDDTHSGQAGEDVFGGWAMFRLSELSAVEVLKALRTGCFYSSSGPDITDFAVANGIARIRCSPATEVHLMAANWHGRSFYAEGSGPVTHAEAPVGDDWRYLRAEVVAEDGRRAWTNPIYL